MFISPVDSQPTLRSSWHWHVRNCLVKIYVHTKFIFFEWRTVNTTYSMHYELYLKSNCYSSHTEYSRVCENYRTHSRSWRVTVTLQGLSHFQLIICESAVFAILRVNGAYYARLTKTKIVEQIIANILTSKL